MIMSVEIHNAKENRKNYIVYINIGSVYRQIFLANNTPTSDWQYTFLGLITHFLVTDNTPLSFSSHLKLFTFRLWI